MDVDARLRAPRGPHADARLRGDARGCHGSVREELAAGASSKMGKSAFVENRKCSRVGKSVSGRGA